MACFSPFMLVPLPVEEMEVGRLREGQEELFSKRMRQRRKAASFSDKTEVIEFMVYIDKLLYDRYQQNRAALEQHILAILNLVCTCACMHVGVYYSLQCASVCEECVCVCARRVCVCVCVLGGILSTDAKLKHHEQLQLALSPCEQCEHLQLALSPCSSTVCIHYARAQHWQTALH